MCEVYRSTFEMAFPLIEEAVKNAEFIAIDTEFTGLVYSSQFKPSLFDNSEERYRKLKMSISEFIPTQMGLSAFVKIPKENKYVAHSFSSYLYPMSFGPVDIRFSCQASSFEFLCKHNFDFNKFAYEGVSFMNEEQEKAVKEHLMAEKNSKGLERDVDEKLLQKYCSRVAEWLVHHKEGDTFILQDDTEALEIETFVLQNEIRQRFPKSWTEVTELGHIVVEIVSGERRKELEKITETGTQDDQDKYLKSLLGWTRVFRLLTRYQKPLIGHNMFMDLLFIFDKFHKPLPERYSSFKEELHRLFPVVFDTKHIVMSARKLFEETGLLEETDLGSLYLAFNGKKGKFHTLCSPGIIHADGFDRYRDQFLPHEAGFDAFQCGSLFLRLAHILHFQGVKSMEVEPCPFRSYLSSLHIYNNNVNVIRATINFINLDGPDPSSKRPEVLFVQSKKASYSLSSLQLAKWFSAYGSVDIKMDGRRKALVATGNHRCAKDILRAFRTHNKITVRTYNFWRHSPLVRSSLWVGAVLSGSLCVWVLWSSRKTS